MAATNGSDGGDSEEDTQLKELCKICKPPIEFNPTSLSAVTKLNLPECGLTELPSDLGKVMPALSILFMPKSKFKEVPAVIGSCPSLQVRRRPSMAH